MTEAHLLKNLPTKADLDSIARLFPSADLSAVETYFALLGVAGDVLSATNAQMSKHKTSFGRWRVLAQLIRRPDQRLTPCELAERIGVTRATVTGLLDGLELSGYLKREGSKEDRRSVHVRLLPKGKKFMDAMMPDRFRHISQVMAHLTEQERISLRKLLMKVEQGVAQERESK